ncbi:Hexose carrier protein [Nymphaea thermarum]|nr:Hexose carrier protein [Nymphaea thermarum]
MATGIALETDGRSSSCEYKWKMTPYLVLSCMMAAIGGVIFGYDIGISGGVTSMDSFLKKFFPSVYVKMKEDTTISNYCKFDSELLTSFTSSLYVAGLVSTFFAATLTRKFGRKMTMTLGGAAFLVGTALGAAAVKVYMLILGRLLLGAGLGFTNQSVPLYLSEMAPPRFRGFFNNGFQFSVGIGVLSANLINYGTQKIAGGWGWRVSLALAALPASALTVGSLFLADTPNSLMDRGATHEKIIATLCRIRGTSDVELELNHMVQARNVSKNIRHPYTSIFSRRYRPQLTMAILIPFFQQVTGINVIAFYAPLLFRTIGLRESASLMSSVVTGGAGLVTTFLSMLIVDKFGRRALFIVGGMLMFCAQVAVGAIMAEKLGDHGALSKADSYLVLVLIGIYVSGFGISWGPLGWLVPSEIYPLEIRSAGQSITVAVSFTFTFLIAQTFLAMLCHMKSGIFFFFSVWVVVMTGFVYLFLPETKDIPIEQMARVWRMHWFWHRFAGEEEDKKVGN